jgi:RNA polymerase sigma-70 factor, ECF subfamily
MAEQAPDDDDAALAQRFREGDEDAVRDVYRRYAGAMYTSARWLLRDDARAADAVQQAFLQAWRSAASFDTSRPLSPWLFQITRRVCIDAIRRARRRPVTTELIGEGDLGAVDDTAEVERSWTRWEVRRAIGQLPPPERDVARLAYVDGLSHREIAGRLGLPVGTVKSRTSRVQAKLAGALAHLAPTASEPPQPSAPPMTRLAMRSSS